MFIHDRKSPCFSAISPSRPLLPQSQASRSAIAFYFFFTFLHLVLGHRCSPGLIRHSTVARCGLLWSIVHIIALVVLSIQNSTTIITITFNFIQPSFIYHPSNPETCDERLTSSKPTKSLPDHFAGVSIIAVLSRAHTVR